MANSNRPLKSIFPLRSPHTKPNPPPALALLSRVFRLRLLRLRNLALHYRLRHLPLRRVCIRAARMNRVHAHIQNVPTAEAFA